MLAAVGGVPVHLPELQGKGQGRPGKARWALGCLVVVGSGRDSAARPSARLALCQCAGRMLGL